MHYWQRILAVVSGGFIGGGTREALELLFNGPTFPFGTLLINLSGTLLSVVAVVIFIDKFTVNPLIFDFISVGILGAYTTYATLITETLTKLTPLAGITYITFSIFGSVLMVYLGRYVARKVVHLT